MNEALLEHRLNVRPRLLQFRRQENVEPFASMRTRLLDANGT
jgi:hypothetical protein